MCAAFVLLVTSGVSSAALAKHTSAKHRTVHRTACVNARKVKGKSKPRTKARVRRCAKPVKHTVRGRTKAPAPKPAPRPVQTTTSRPTTTTATQPTSTTLRQSAPVTPPATNSVPAGASAWDKPALVDPTTLVINATNSNLVLNQSKDYILYCLPGPVALPSGLTVWGGHNVVIDGCEIDVTGHSGGMALKNTTGTMWLHDIRISGDQLMEGIDLQEGGATVVMRDVLIDTVYGSYSTNHADLIQTWAGPARLLIDGFTGTTQYQGFFLLPNQWYTGAAPTQWDLRNVDIDDTQGAYALWVSDQDGAFPLNVQNVYVADNQARTWRGWWLWGFGDQDSNTPGQGTWANVVAGAPPAGHYVTATAGGVTGVDEGVSPAALQGEQP